MRIIRGKYGKRRFDVPKNITARPTTDFARENIFNVLENLTDLEDDTALDLFAGTGAISLEFLSRGCTSVTAVEKARVQTSFLKSLQSTLHDPAFHVIHMDVFRYIATCADSYDVVFADPPYDLPWFAEVPERVLGSTLVKPGGLFVLEHSKTYDFSALPHFDQHRAYGSVNFSIFRLPAEE
ncbi:MAG: RsmD family RNA methyltransferase [Lepagella sp.]